MHDGQCLETDIPADSAGMSEPSGADDRARTGDLDLGKVALYQLSYVRVLLMIADPVSRANRTYEGVASISAVTSSSR